MVNYQDRIVVITGMHRSGTSLVASYLKKCGLKIGNNLLPGAPDNPKGFFEDEEFVTLHDAILKRQLMPLFSPGEPNLPPEDIKQIKNLITQKENKNQGSFWGWKDPRTVIFLPVYKKIIPNANYILIYRHPFHVVDSLIRRWSDWWIRLWPFNAALSWIWYNKKILKFKRNNPNQTILISLSNFIKYPQNTINTLNKRFETNLKEVDFSEVYDPNMLKKDIDFSILTKIVINIYKKRLLKLWQELEEEKVDFKNAEETN